MITGLDHVVILVRDIEAAAAAYGALLGRAVAWRSADEASASVLFTLDNMSVELLAGAPGAAGDHIRAALEANGEGLASLCFRVEDIANWHRRLDRLGLRPEAVGDGGSRNLLDGARLAWKRTRAATDAAHGVRLFFLDMNASRPASVVNADAPVTGLDHVVVETADPERAAALYGARLRLDMRLDRSHADWGHLMFFRCGDLIVETVKRAGKDYSDGRDRLWGLSFRVDDIARARARMQAAGIEVSEPRAGRKPGTFVATVRSGTHGVPTILLQPPGR
ncbi:MAG: VOC family protein [Xanthobacteraceae bacterium]|nr:VOC family protein [Xanthobacteraceae bacterium]